MFLFKWTDSSLVAKINFYENKHIAWWNESIFFDFMNRYLEVLLRRVTVNIGQIVYSPNRKAFVTVAADNNSKENLYLAAEEYADLTGECQDYKHLSWITVIMSN